MVQQQPLFGLFDPPHGVGVHVLCRLQFREARIASCRASLGSY